MKVWVGLSDGELLLIAVDRDSAHDLISRQGWQACGVRRYQKYIRKMDGGYWDYAKIEEREVYQVDGQRTEGESSDGTPSTPLRRGCCATEFDRMHHTWCSFNEDASSFTDADRRNQFDRQGSMSPQAAGWTQNCCGVPHGSQHKFWCHVDGSPEPPTQKQCPYTHSHTRHWCGYDTCREA